MFCSVGEFGEHAAREVRVVAVVLIIQRIVMRHDAPYTD